MQRTFAAGLIAAVFVMSSLPLFSQTAPQPASSGAAQGQAAPRRPMPKPTNLQVLPKDISSEDLMARMQSYSKALGVECLFCHTQDPRTHQPDFASDSNPDKAIARIMIGMTQEINVKYLSQVTDPDATPADKTVSCGTCHRGNSMPTQFTSAAGGGVHRESNPAPKKPE